MGAEKRMAALAPAGEGRVGRQESLMQTVAPGTWIPSCLLQRALRWPREQRNPQGLKLLGPLDPVCRLPLISPKLKALIVMVRKTKTY